MDTKQSGFNVMFREYNILGLESADELTGKNVSKPIPRTFILLTISRYHTLAT